MVRTLLNPPPDHTTPFNTGDSIERGDSPKTIVDALNSMLGVEGATVVDFGAFPGTQDTTTVITGQTAILAGSEVRAWLVATATVDHSVDEHWLDGPIITVGNIVPGTGFTIYAISKDGGSAFGKWTVQWAWD